jgi:prolycopene isomerase
MKRSIAKKMIEQVSAHLGVNLLDHIVEIEIESPMTIARYTGMYQGGIYGYQHSMDNSVVGRLEDVEREQYIKGLVGCASHQLVGDGMACNINNGRIASKIILEEMAKEAAK